MGNLHPGPRLSLEVAGVEAFRMLRDNAARLAPPGAGPEAARLIALHAWALDHGLATLILDGQIPRDDALIDALLKGGPGTVLA